jgi:hypothetical protein
MTKKELNYEIALIDMRLGGLELKLGLKHGITETEKQSIINEISTLKDKRLGLKGAFRLS